MPTSGRSGSWQLLVALLSLGVTVGAHAAFDPETLFAEEPGQEVSFSESGGEGGGSWDCEQMTRSEWCNCAQAVFYITGVSSCQYCVQHECDYHPGLWCSLSCTCYGCFWEN